MGCLTSAAALVSEANPVARDPVVSLGAHCHSFESLSPQKMWFVDIYLLSDFALCHN